MADSFLGEIKLFAGNFAPKDWAFCDGALVPISENTTLFALLGTIYGGDGRVNFALPDLRGRIPVHMGRGPGLSTYYIGERVGYEKVVLNQNQLGSHTHGLQSSSANTTSDAPGGKMLGQSTGQFYTATTTQPVAMKNTSISTTGSGQSHENVMPSLCLNFIISLQGDFPSRN